MRLQSAIEFLSTYSFMFLALGIVLSVLLFFGTSPRAFIPNQCTAFSGPNCVFANYYSNQISSYSIITIGATDSVGVPLNVSNVIVQIGAANSTTGACTPSTVLPGGLFTCFAIFKTAPGVGTLIQGFYSINARFCNSGLYAVHQSNCTNGDPVSYAGYFAIPPVVTSPFIFSVSSGNLTGAIQLPAYQTTPLVFPAGFNALQNGDWISGKTGYAFGNSVIYGSTKLGLGVNPYPAILSRLNNQNIACSAPYNSILSIASTMVYVPSGTATVTANAYVSNAIQLYYKTSSNIWTPLFNSILSWNSMSGPTTLGPNSMLLTQGINYITVIWVDDCGAGAQVLNLTGLPKI